MIPFLKSLLFTISIMVPVFITSEIFPYKDKITPQADLVIWVASLTLLVITGKMIAGKKNKGSDVAMRKNKLVTKKHIKHVK